MESEMGSWLPAPSRPGGSATWVAESWEQPLCLVWCREEISAILSCDSADRWLEASVLHLCCVKKNCLGFFFLLLFPWTQLLLQEEKEDITWRPTESVSQPEICVERIDKSTTYPRIRSGEPAERPRDKQAISKWQFTLWHTAINRVRDYVLLSPVQFPLW